MFAEVVLLSEESRYVSPYMNYGFTPGAGATWVIAEKAGPDLARESLLTGRQYAGSELKARGPGLVVLPRAQVREAAMILARQMAQGSRQQLIALKRQLTGHVQPTLEETYRLELAMHEKTFVGRSDTLAQIEKSFYQEAEVAPAAGQPAPIAAEALHSPADSEVLPAITATLKTLLAQELQMRESDIDPAGQFIDLGLDSISGVTWVRKINELYHTSIAAAALYSHSALDQLSGHVKEEAEKQGTLAKPKAFAAAVPVADARISPQQRKIATRMTTGRVVDKLTSWRTRTATRLTGVPASRPSHAADPIAVIGMAGQFPQAKNLEEFWRNIAEGKDCISPVPRNRWDVNAWYQPGDPAEGKTNSQWVGALEEYDRFDPLFFNISPTEAENMDPQQRLFLQACWHSIEDAGYDPRVLSGQKCGVFVGCADGHYHQLSRQHQLSAQGFTGSSMSILAARISYFLNLQGPCISIDTACSSSLVAIAHACDSLNSGGSDVALAGGVYVMAGPDLHIMTAQAGMLSRAGRCFTFDQRADGFVPGEGVGVVLLKRLADAQRDRDIIYGVIQGWGVNQDGRTNGITAPNPESQTRLEQEVYDKYGIDPANIQLIEAHGTGTKLGDPIEVEGLKKAFKKYTGNQEYCALGSVKSNIGHCLTAAGVAGFIKVMLAAKHQQLPPTINFGQLNEHIDLRNSPFYINRQLREWKPGSGLTRQAAISSFGFSGTNAHIVVGEYQPAVEVKPPASILIAQGEKTIIPLSARTAEQLRQKAQDLLDFIRRQGPSIELIEMACTLQMGRAAMEERMGCVVNSVEQLAEKLEAYVNGESGIKDLHQGQGKRGKESMGLISLDDEVKDALVNKWIEQKKLSRLLELWVKGLDPDWSKLYGEVRPRRMNLPVYPFARERYWIDATANIVAGAKDAAAAVLHPLVHRNTSDLSGLRYSSTFTGKEFFLADHQVAINGHGRQKMLPGVACLEMARAAIEQAAPIQPETEILELRDIAWPRPVVVENQTQISIVVFTNDDDQIGYEVYSAEGEEITVHCEGRAVFSPHSAPARIDIEDLKGQMKRGILEPVGIYAIFDGMGLHYGPAHQGVAAIHLGEKQLLAQLRLPAVVETSRTDYVLHPSLMDSALQASIGLMIDHVPSQPTIPFVLESLRILSPCQKEMLAWVRYSKGSGAEDKIIKLDIDLCDREGNVCVRMAGFSLRVLKGEPAPQIPARDSVPAEENFIEDCPSFDSAFYGRLLTDIQNHEVSVEEALRLG